MTRTIPLPEPALHIVLVHPEIPQNTGNIGRTCVAIEAKLWLVRPLGFRLDDHHMRRAGLDYWQHLDWEAVDSLEHLHQRLDAPFAWHYFSAHATGSYTGATYQAGDVLVFGSESRGLPASMRATYPDRFVTLPTTGPVRSLNLASTVAAASMEALRQIGSPSAS